VRPYIIEEDCARQTLVVDVDRWAEEFEPVDGIVEATSRTSSPATG
jgi:adenylate kinase